MIDPKPIHPVFIYVAKLVLQGTEFDDEWHTPKRGQRLTWDEENPIILRGQLKNEKMGMYMHSREGSTRPWITVSRMSFWVKSEELVGDDGNYKLDKGDKIIKMEDLDGFGAPKLDLFVSDVVWRAPYERFGLIQIMCEKESPQVG